MATTARRVALSLAVVFCVLVTSGWLPHGERAEPGSYAAQLLDWRQDEITGVALPDPEAGPARIEEFFSTLGHRKQLLLARRYPLVVGNLDGVPVEVRYAANRHALAEALAAERQRLKDERLSPTGQRETERRVHRFRSLMAPDRQILAFDPTGQGRAAEVFGDLSAAERVSIVVPGVHTELLTFERSALKYHAPAGMAEALYLEQRRAAPEVEGAVIAWADYTAPSRVSVAAATGDLAEEGAERLAATVAGLPEQADVALFCHSYGSVVCGVAAGALPGSVTDIAVAGSPGMRVSEAGELGTDARVWAARAEDDWIRDVPYLSVGPLGHGKDPALPAFGALPVPSHRVSGHSGYFEPGTDTLETFGQIGVGLAAGADVLAATGSGGSGELTASPTSAAPLAMTCSEATGGPGRPQAIT